MHTKDNRSKRFLLIFAIVFALMCILCHKLLADAATGTHGESGFYVAFTFCATLVFLIGGPSALLAGIIYTVLPEKWGGDG